MDQLLRHELMNETDKCTTQELNSEPASARRLARVLLFIATCATLIGCATSSTSLVPPDMRVATADTVGNCRLLGDVHGVSGLYGVFAEKALADCRQKAFKQARALGANTIVWGAFATPYGSTSVSGNAYLCPP